MIYTTTGGWLIAMIRTLADRGVDIDAFLACENLDLEAVRRTNARIDFAVMKRLWGHARRMSGEPAIGLLTAEFVRPTTFGPLTYAIYASDSLLTALRVLSRYVRIFSDAGVYWVRESDGETALLAMTRERAADQVIDASIAAFIKIFRDLTVPGFSARSVTLGRPEPGDAKPWLECFGTPVTFSGDGPSILSFDAKVVREPLLGHNAELYEHAVGLMETQLADMKRGAIVALVRAQIVEGLTEGTASINQAAGALGISTRTLQRRLADQGQDFTTLVDEVRRDLAERYLAKSRLSVTNVGYLLGFDNLPNFSRAFRRWHGTTPSDFRARTLQRPS